MVIVRNGRQWKRTDFLTAEAPVVPGEENLPSRPRGEADGAPKRRPDAEVCLEATRSSGSLQSSDVNAKLLGELVEWQQLLLMSAIGGGDLGPLKHG